MAVTITGATVLQRVIETAGLGDVATASEIDDLAANYIQSYIWFRNKTAGSNRLLSEGAIIFRPDAANASDYIRYVAEAGQDGETGKITPDVAWTDVTKTSETFYFLKNEVHPLWLIQAMNRAMGKCYFENTEPLSAKPAGAVLADAGFQSTATSSYVESDADAGAATTFSKITTANSENAFQGLGSGRVLNAATGGYIRQRFNVTEQELVVVHALSRLASGTNAQLVLQDVTGAVAIGTTVAHDQGAWQWMRRGETIPADCKVMEVRWQGEGTTDDVYWGGHSILFPEQARVILDTKWDTAHKIPSLVSVQMGGSSPATGVHPAMASRLVEIPRSDYDFLFERPGANPYGVQFHNGSQRQWFQNPVFIQGRRAYSDLTTFTVQLTETTGCDLDLLEAATRVEMFQDRRIASRVPDSNEALADAYGAFLAVNKQFEQRGPAQRKEPVIFSGLGN